MSLLGNAERGLTQLDRLLPDAFHQVDAETRMRGRLFAIIVLSTVLIGLNGAAIHFGNDSSERGFLIVACLTLSPATLAVARSKRGLHIALSLFLSLLLVAIFTGPAITGDVVPVSVAVSTVPIFAVAVGGLRLGLAWTVLTVCVISAAAFSVRADPATALIVANTLIAAGAGGFGCCFLEMLRKLESRNAQLATKEVRAEAKKRMSVEADLEQSKTIISESFKQSPSMFVLADMPSMRIVDVNHSFERISGWTLDEAKGRTLGELGAWGSPGLREPLMDALGDSGAAKQIEVQLRTRSNEPVWLLATASVVQLGGQWHILAQAIDITERKAATEALMQHRDLLETRLDQNDAALRDSMRELTEHRHLASIGTLAAGIAHQINNPIGAIMAAAEFALVLDDDDPDREKSREGALQTAVAESQRCGRIVHNLLRFARHEPTARWVEDITPLVGRAVELARAYVLENGGQLHTHISDEPLYAMISPIELEQALVNLLRNAAESLEGRGRVEVRTTRIEDVVEIEIRDDGRGIEADKLRHVFEPFYTTRLHDGGTGLGLSFAHGVTSGHGGQLLLDSALEKGTRARLRLQLVPPPKHAGEESLTPS